MFSPTFQLLYKKIKWLLAWTLIRGCSLFIWYHFKAKMYLLNDYSRRKICLELEIVNVFNEILTVFVCLQIFTLPILITLHHLGQVLLLSKFLSVSQMRRAQDKLRVVH